MNSNIADIDSPASSEMDELIERVQSLPAELYNHIQKLTFATDSTQSCDINSEYKPPVLLHVQKPFRQVFARAYYSKTNFQFEDLELCCTWLKSLPEEHRRRIGNLHGIIRVECEESFLNRVSKQMQKRYEGFETKIRGMGGRVYTTLTGNGHNIWKFHFYVYPVRLRDERAAGG